MLSFVVWEHPSNGGIEIRWTGFLLAEAKPLFITRGLKYSFLSTK